MATTSMMAWPARISASGRFGVSTAACGTRRRFKAPIAPSSISRAPPFATMTGSRTSGIPAARSAMTAATVSMTAASCSMPVFSASAPRSSSTTSICCRMKSGGIGRTPNTPVVFCAVSAVTAVIAKPPSIVTVLMSAWMPAPPPESEPAMINTRPFIPGPSQQAPALFRGPHRRFDLFGALRDGEDRRADVVDDAGQQAFVFALRHDADDGLGPGIADYEPALFAEPRLGGGNRPLDPRCFERSSMTETHIAQKLRHRLEDAADFARMLAGLDDRRQDLQCRDEPITGCRVIAEDDVAGLFAAEIAAEAAHLLDDIAVADRGTVEPDPLLRKTVFEPEVRHDCRDQRAALQTIAMRHICRDQRHQLVAVEDDAALIRDDQPVGIPVERDADIGTARQDLLPHILRRQRAAIAIDVEAVRRDGDREDLSAQLPGPLRQRPPSGPAAATTPGAASPCRRRPAASACRYARTRRPPSRP